MKKSSTLVLFILVAMSTRLFAAGGPDTYGYTWKDSNDPGGPVYTWFDISTIGTPVTGLADDNSAPSQINIGFNFHYYWSDYNKVKIGSNGWISFDNPSNIASCFPGIPTSGGAADNILAAFMTDLTFQGAGNIATCHYWTNFTDSFIVQYTNAPYWMAAAPGYTGSTTFQILLCGLDSSITFQYVNTTPFTDILGCNDLVVGIENISGSIGLGVYTDVTPPGNYAIKFYYPAVPLVAVQDATPYWNQNTGSRGIIVGAGAFPLQANIKNVGNANIVTPINVSAQIRDLAFVLYYSDGDTIANMNAGAGTTITFNQPTLNTAGPYSLLVSTSNANDLNPANNQRLSEIDVVNACGTATFTYHSSNAPDATISWNGGTGTDDGLGIFYKPPIYPITINSLEFYIMSNVSDGFEARIYLNDGAFGAPGTLVSTTAVPMASVVAGMYNVVNLASPVNIDSAGFYVVWLQTGPTIALGLETAFPYSRNNYEILDGSWSEFRFNEDQDAAVKVNVITPGLDNSTTQITDAIMANQPGATYQWLDCANSFAVIPGETAQTFTYSANGSYACQVTFGGCVDTTSCVLINNFGMEENVLNAASVFPNPAQSTVWIRFNEPVGTEDMSLLITDISGKMITLPFSYNQDQLELNIANVSNGIYTWQVYLQDKLFAIGKFVKQ